MGRRSPAILFGLALAGACAAREATGPAPPPAPEPTAEVEATALAAVAEEDRAPADPAPVPPVVRISLEHERAIDRAVLDTLARGGAPGCVVLLGRSDGVVFRRAYGARAIDPMREPMTADTVFDLASLTKAVATTSAVLWLAERGRIELDAPVSRYLPDLAGGGRERITVRHLLTHRAGLPAVDPLRGYDGERREVLARILRTPLESAPGARVRYSDLGFIVLGALVERVTGRDLDAFVRETIFEPLGMRETRYAPPSEWLPRIAPTERAERRGGVLIRGVVHDPRAFRLGGVAGNAGLFSTADDLARFARMLLRGGELDGARVFSAETVRAIRSEEGERGLGWDRGHPTLSPAAFGHGGFTGTSLWIDPDEDLFVLLLSNRVHPNGRGDVQPLVRELGRIAREAVPGARPPVESAVLTGIDVLRRDGFAAIDGARVALLTHDAARARDGARTLDLLAAAPNVELVSVLSPEHGLSGTHEGRVAGGRDERTGLTVHSLFGPTRTPTDAMLAGADTLVVDLVDVGVRFYTYASTMRRAMEAAAARGMRVVVLDRPDPLGGGEPRGPVCEPALASFVNHHALPAVHGMTIGELALLLDDERSIGARPTIVRLEGWRRGMRFSDTGLRWVPPSPNLRTPEQALLYPALGLLEGTNVSVGRGTDAPFELLGAPWMDPEAVIAELGELDGARVEPVRFVPRAARHRGIPCRGLRFVLEDAARFDAVRTGLAIARALRRAHPSEWDAEAMRPMIGSDAVHRALLDGADVAELERIAAPALREFAERRRRYLLYP
ncbi:MAG TPA: serine hydrolase [Sandaracinaceae bacterium]